MREMHGGFGTLTYERWRSMIQRCHDPARSHFRRYGAKGISVCDAWRHSFAAFLAHMGACPSRAYSLDRLKNERGYEPGNCRWATSKQQSRNRTNNTWLTFRGETLTQAEWVERLGLPQTTISGRLRRGWSVERALSTPSPLQRTNHGTDY